MKIRPLGAEVFHADGQRDGQSERRTDMMKLTVAFLNFAKAPRNWRIKIRWDVMLCRLGLCDTEEGGGTLPRNAGEILPVEEAHYSTKY